MRIQTGRRDLYAHHSTGALEPRLKHLRTMLEQRKWTFRNRERMNLLLELMRMHINRVDQPQRYLIEPRAALEGGTLPSRRPKLADPVSYRIGN